MKEYFFLNGRKKVHPFVGYVFSPDIQREQYHKICNIYMCVCVSIGNNKNVNWFKQMSLYV